MKSNEEHIAFLLEKGVQSWNEARRVARNDSLADKHLDFLVWTSNFSGVNFLDEFLDSGKPFDQWPISLAEIDLVEADLSNAMLRLVNLASAKLAHANLSGANLEETILIGADLEGAFLNNTRLSEANLADADLRNALLYDADLSDANVSGADLTTTTLIGADLSGTELWKARLFALDTSTPTQYMGQQGPIESIDDLLNETRNLKIHHHKNDGNIIFYFRGEQQCGWELKPSIMREQFTLSESEMLIELMSRRPEEFSTMPSSLAQWVLGQHHGLKTRFLDVTKNPLVALFHACEDNGKYKDDDAQLHVFGVPRSLIKSFNSDTASVIANFAKLSEREQDLLLGKRVTHQKHSVDSFRQYQKAKERLHQFIQEEKHYFQDRIDVKDFFRVILVEPQQLSERLRVQSGAFLVSAYHERFEREEIERKVQNVPVYAHYTLSIPHRSKPRIIEDLQLINIRRETLYPGLDESAKAIIQPS